MAFMAFAVGFLISFFFWIAFTAFMAFMAFVVSIARRPATPCTLRGSNAERVVTCVT
jgi:hypothetical protein